MLARFVAAPFPAVNRLAWSVDLTQSLGRRHHLRTFSVFGPLINPPRPLRTSFLPALRSSTLRCRSSYTSETGNSNIFLIIYSKPGCHLCDGLKEKLQAVLDKAMFQPSPLSNASLQIRNILEEPAWEAEYGMVIPVLTAIKSGEKEEIKIPRAPPRISPERLSEHIVKALKL